MSKKPTNLDIDKAKKEGKERDISPRSGGRSGGGRNLDSNKIAKKKSGRRKSVKKTGVTPRYAKKTARVNYSEYDGEHMNDEEVNALFAQRISQLGVSEEAASKMEIVHKRMLLAQSENYLEAHQETGEIKKFIKMLDRFKRKANIDSFIQLRVGLSAQSAGWVNDFVEEYGIQRIVDIFKISLEEDDSEMISECCLCIKALLNVPLDTYDIFEQVMLVPDLMRYVVRSLGHLNEKLKGDVYNLLAAVSISSSEKFREIYDEIVKSDFGLDTVIIDLVESYNNHLEESAIILLNAIIYAFDNEKKYLLDTLHPINAAMDKLVDRAETRPTLMAQLDLYVRTKAALEFNADASSFTDVVSDRRIAELNAQIQQQQRIIDKLEAKMRGEYVSDSPMPTRHGTTPPGPVVLAGNAPPPPPPPPGGIIGGPGIVLSGNAPPPPPPPGGITGGPGMPPPPPMIKNFGLPDKPIWKPNKKMPGFNWTKITPKFVIGTFWEKANDQKFALDFDDIEEKFGRNEIVQIDVEDIEKPTKVEVVNLLSGKRSMNTQIMLKGVKRDHVEIRRAIQGMREKKFTVENLFAMNDFIPDPEEIKALTEYDGDKEVLGVAERYFLEIMKIPNFQLRVSSLLFKATFKEKYLECQERCEFTRTAVRMMKKDKRFYTFLEIVLAMGNFVNGGTKRGQSYGYQLNSLIKLVDSRSPNRQNFTLLHYIIDFVGYHHVQVLDFFDELEPVRLSSRDAIDDLNSHISKLAAELNPIETYLSSNDCDKYFHRSMNDFAVNARNIVDNLRSSINDIKNDFIKLLEFYGEKKLTKSEDFFGWIQKLNEQVHKCITDNLLVKEQLMKEAKQKTQRSQLKKLHSRELSQGKLDAILLKMKQGKGFKK